MLTAIWEATIYAATAAVLGTLAALIGGVIIATTLGLEFPVVATATIGLIAGGGIALILAATAAPAVTTLRDEIPRILAVE